MNHKRKHPRWSAICKLCKPWKMWGNRKDRKPISDQRKLELGCETVEASYGISGTAGTMEIESD